MTTPYVFPDDATDSDVRTLVFRGHADVRSQFDRAFPAEIEACLASLTKAYAMYHDFGRVAPHTSARTGTVNLFFYTALNSLFTSLHLLISGMLTPSRHMMRQYGEATAMALLCSSPALLHYARFAKEPDHYPIDKAVHECNKKTVQRILDLNGLAWNSFLKNGKVHSKFSHATSQVMTTQFLFDRDGMLAILGEFDAAKSATYRNELLMHESAARVLAGLIAALRDRLPFDPDEPSSAQIPSAT